jgi:hypothetical protein
MTVQKLRVIRLTSYGLIAACYPLPIEGLFEYRVTKDHLDGEVVRTEVHPADGNRQVKAEFGYWVRNHYPERKSAPSNGRYK